MSDRILAKPLEGYSAEAIHNIMSAYDLVIYDSLEGEEKVYIAEYQGSAPSNLFGICNTLFELEAFRYVTPDFIYTSEFLCSVPQDPYFVHQWHLNNTGQTGGTDDADIDMPEAWDLLPEESGPLLAILDYGFDLYHEDLRGDMFYWPYDIIGETFLDDRPWIPDGNPQPPRVYDLNVKTHGTMMLGLVAPLIDDEVGLAGIEDTCRIMPIKICDIYGNFDHISMAKAFRYASTRPWPPDVYCLALHVGHYFPDVEDELRRLYNNGHPVFAAAGNDAAIEYPASSPYAFAVGATDKNDLVINLSGKGPALDACAPGEEIWSFDLSGADGLNDGSLCNGDADYYCNYWGTSPATAIVAGLATKLLATRPDLIPKMSNAEPLYELMRKSAKDLYSPGHDNVSGYGRVNACRAIVAIDHGDVNQDFDINVSDVICIINYVFIHGDPPRPYLCLGDANCDGKVNVSDAVYLLNYIFVHGAPPEICYLNLPE